jgi:insulysin
MNKTIFDHREYKFIKIKNELKSIIIKDDKTNIASCCLAVGCGYYDEEIQGLAHFLEHMLFMGSKKYPNEDEYFKFISENGGTSNAYTTGDLTSYYFEINNNKLFECLDMLANFFIEPLLNKEAIDREINAVDSEHKKNINNDNWRTIQLIRNNIKDNHYAHGFSTGSVETLKIKNIYEKLCDFYNNYYSANNMYLIVIGNYDLNIMENKINEIFSLIPNKNVIKNRSKELPFNLPISIKATPIKKEHSLKYVFQIPKTKEDYKNKLMEFINYILLNENEDTMVCLLKNNNLAYSINGGIIEELSDYYLYILEIILTEKGINNIKEIEKIIQKYINLIFSNNKNLNKLYQQFKTIKQNSMNLFEITNNTDYIVNLCDTWCRNSHIPIDKILISNFFLDDNESLLEINKYYNYFCQKMTLIFSPNFINKEWNIDKWYGIKYKKYDQNILFCIKPLNLNLDLPKKNIFLDKIQVNKQNQKKEGIYPEIILEDKGIKVYHKYEINYDIPNIYFSLFIYINDLFVSHNNLNNYIYYVIKLECLNLIFNTLFYNVGEAGYNISLKLKNWGIKCVAYGYYQKFEKIIKLIRQIITLINKDNISEDVFNKIIDKLINKYENYKFLEPYLLVKNNSKNHIEYNNISEDLILNIIKKIKYNDFINHHKYLNNPTNYMTIFINGYCSKNDAIKFSKIIYDAYDKEKLNKLDKIEKINNYINLIPKNKEYIKQNYNINDSNSSVLYNIYIGNILDLKKYILLKMAHMIVSKEFFNILRTQQQLGYICKSYIRFMGEPTNYHIYYNLLIQSNHKDVETIKERINNFIHIIKNNIINHNKLLNHKIMETLKKNIIDELEKPFTNLLEDSLYYQEIIMIFENNKNIKKDLINLTNNLNKEDLINFIIHDLFNLFDIFAINK